MEQRTAGTVKHRRVKLLISMFYGALILLGRILLNALGKKPEGRCTVVYFHSVKDGEKDKFRRQMSALKKDAVVLSAGYAGRLPKGKTYVILTFDDGFKSLVANAIPELVRFRIPCAIFFPVKYLGCRPGWEFNLRFSDENEEIMTASDIRKLPGDIVTIGSHSFSHRIMTDLNPQELKEELSKSKESLEAISGNAVNLFSFPYGAFNTDIIKQAIAAGYKRAFTGSYEVFTSEINSPAVGRVRVDPSDSILEFRLKIIGAYGWMRHLKRLKENLLSLKWGTSKMKRKSGGYITSGISS